MTTSEKVADRYGTLPGARHARKEKSLVKTALGFAAASLKLLCIEMPSSDVLCSLSAHHNDNQGIDAPRCLKFKITL